MTVFSISKTPVTPETAQELVSAMLGPAARITGYRELTDGFFNAAYALELAGGPRCVLKVAPDPAVRVMRYERDILAAEVEALRRARAATSIPAPEVYGHLPGGRVIASPCFLMEHLGGESFHKARPAMAPEAVRAVERAAGGYLRELHAITEPGFGYCAPGAPRHRSWAAAFAQMLGDVLADGAELGVALPRPAEALLDDARRAAPALDEVETPRLVHWDMWDGNIFVDPAAGAITGVVDFERALWGDPLMEFQFRTPQEGGAFAEGYGASLQDTPGRRLRRSLYSVYLYLIMVIECRFRQYETDDQERWARGQLDAELARLDGLLGRGAGR